jgi:hypothetical protein
MGISHYPTFAGEHVPPPLDLRRAYAAAARAPKKIRVEDVNLRGTAVAPVRSFVLAQFGEKAWGTFLEDLEPATRAIIEQPVIATNWYPYAACCAYIDGLVVLAGGRQTVVRDFAIHNLDYATNVVFRAIFKLGTPEFMVARSDQVWRKLYSHGRMICDVKPGRARIELHDFPMMSERYSDMVKYSIEAVLLKAGAHVARAELTKSPLFGDASSEFSFAWT